MPSEALEARQVLLQKWADVMTDQVQQFQEQCADKGMSPNWFYPRKVVQTGQTLRIHWSLRPEVETALVALRDGGSVEQAAHLGALAGQRSLEDLITDDTIWEYEDAATLPRGK